MGWLDKALNAPGDIAGKAAEAAARLPGVPVDVTGKVIDGVEQGVDKLISPKPRSGQRPRNRKEAGR